MACVDSPYQPSLYDPTTLQDSFHYMGNKSLLQATQHAHLINFRIYETEPTPERAPMSSKYHNHRASFVKRCSQLATGRHPSLSSTNSPIQKQAFLVQWVQRLPSSPQSYESFLESALEEAVSQLVCGPNVAAEESELGYNYDTLDDAALKAWVRVQAQRVESQGKVWIAASVQSKVGPGERAEVYAYGRWRVVRIGRGY